VIEKEPFLAGLAILAGAFGREVDAPVQRAYYAVLSPQMTTEDFEKAVSLTLASESYWPSPAVILSKVKADAESRGLVAFERVNRVMGANGGHRFLSHDTYIREFDEATRMAISAVGGLAKIGDTTEDRWPALQRRFVAAHTEASSPTKRLPAAPIDPRVDALVNRVLSGRDRAAGAEP
jgi:hypothetical protein